MIELLIGRDQDCDVVIDDPSVSRKHAKLIVTNGDVHVISDFGSKHGTFVKENGSWKRVSSAEVKMHDRVKLGLQTWSISDLLNASTASKPPKHGPMERNPETGEIIPRRS
jgi:predicted component of type VI protein secretion system